MHEHGVGTTVCWAQTRSGVGSSVCVCGSMVQARGTSTRTELINPNHELCSLIIITNELVKKCTTIIKYYFLLLLSASCFLFIISATYRARTKWIGEMS